MLSKTFLSPISFVWGYNILRAEGSCLFQLLDHYIKIKEAQENEEMAEVIFTDLALKAFNRYNHVFMAHKMHKMEITRKVGRWMHNFLTNRSQHNVI